MWHTTHDLSFGKVELDYEALLRTSKIALAHTRNELEKYLSQTHDIKPRFSYTFLADQIKIEADALVVAAETMDTLEGGLTREELMVVNKPLVVEADMAKTEAEQSGAE